MPETATRKSLEPWIKDDIEFYQHQVEGIRTLARRRSFLLADDMGLGKLAGYSEPILTPSGWTEMGKLSIGDQVIGSSGQATDVTHIFEQGVKDLYKVTFSDGSFTRCGLEHLWAVNSPVRKKRGNPNLVLTTNELIKRGLTDAAGNRKWYIPLVKPVEFTPKTQPELDPYAVGVLLGDGGLSQHSATICSDTEIVESLILPEDVKVVKLNEIGEFTSSYRLNGLAKYLRTLNMMGKKAEDKHIPEEYKWGSVATRIATLQGLIDTDGTAVQSKHKPSTTIEYGTVSKQLAQDVKHIVQSLGGTVSIAEKIPTYTYKGEKLEGQLFYRMTLRLPSWLVPFKLERKLEKWIPRSKYEPTRSIVSIELDGSEQARCIRVSARDNLYVTRDFIVTHNSLQALTVFAVDVVRDWAKTCIIVAPATLKANWSDEIEKFSRFPYVVLEGTLPQRQKQLLDFYEMSSPKILIVNYEQIKTHQETLDKLEFDVAIFDEAHYMKNPKSQRTKACLSLYSRRSFLLTGTPMLNHVNELWALLNKIDPEAYPKYYSFINRYCVYGGFKDKQIVGVKNESELHERLQTVMTRRLKKDVLDLPEVQIIERLVDNLPEQQNLYNEVANELRLQRIDKSHPDDIENALVKFLRLKQICGTTLPFNGEDISGKLNLAEEDELELLENGHRTVVFTQFRDVQLAYHDRLIRYGFPVFELHGGVKQADRAGVVKQWGMTLEPGVLICMLQVAGLGLNMTQSRHGSFLDKLWVPGLNQQAIDRLNRIGADETQAIQIREYRVRHTIEARVAYLNKVKSKLFGEIVESDPNWKAKLYEALLEAEE